MSGGGYMVTWTYGNMLSLAMPKIPERHGWMGELPLLPPPFLTVRHVKTDTGWNPDINAVLQLKVIARVFDTCDTPLLRQPTLPARGNAVPVSLSFLGCETLPPPVDLLLDGRSHCQRNGKPSSLQPVRQLVFGGRQPQQKADWLLGVNSSYAVCKAVGFGNNSLGGYRPCIGSDKRTVPGKENHIPQTAGPYSSASARTGR